MSQPAQNGLTRLAVYERSLPVSEERVWENVRDWEHLPWLHAGSFASIALEEEGDWGWRARIGLHRGDAIRLELVIEPDAPRYVSRTLEGSGAGTEIWTDVLRRETERTDVRVEFWTPPVPADEVERSGQRYVQLYTQLWDEDEEMMRVRARELAGARGRGAGASEKAPFLSLGSVEALRPRLPLVVDFAGERWRIVETEDGLRVHATRCPHRLGPLDEARVEDGRVVCPWHGYAFDVETGRECSGRRMRLAPPPRIEVDPQSGAVHLESA